MNMRIIRPLWFLSKVLGKFLMVPKKEFKLNHQNSVFSKVMSCAKSFKSMSANVGRSCRAYCSYFNFNANSPVVEGYRQYVNDYINFLKTFFSSVGHQLKKQSGSRILSSASFTPEFLEQLPDFYQDSN